MITRTFSIDDSIIGRFRRSLLLLYLRTKLVRALWAMLFAYEVRALVAEKAVIKWDRSSRGDLRYLLIIKKIGLNSFILIFKILII
jgi:hypothetical protein